MLVDHVLRELNAGVTQEQLLAESLNVQSLFEADLSELDLHQRELISHVARYAPIAASEVTDRFGPEAVQSLVNRRLLVQVGDRLDTYWDIFRDFINTGRVPIEDSYILRQTPNSVSRLLAKVVSAGGRVEVPAIAAELGTSTGGLFNLSRELRLLGVSAYEPNWVTILPEVLEAADPEQEMRTRVASALRKHRAYSTLKSVADRTGGPVDGATYARHLPAAFPAVDVADSAWRSYARAFLFWFTYAGLATQAGQAYRPTPEGSDATVIRLLDGKSSLRSRPGVPQEAPSRAVAILDRVLAGESVAVGSDKLERSAVGALVGLGAVRVDQAGVLIPIGDLMEVGRREALASLLRSTPGGAAGLEVLVRSPDAAPAEVGAAIRDSIGASWTDSSTHSIGGYFRSWAREAGIETKFPRRGGRRVVGEASDLFGQSSFDTD